MGLFDLFRKKKTAEQQVPGESPTVQKKSEGASEVQQNPAEIKQQVPAESIQQVPVGINQGNYMEAEEAASPSTDFDNSVADS